MKLSVIIPSRNRYFNLVPVLDALEDQSLAREEYEIILSDDASTDETQTLINHHRDKGTFKYVWNNYKPHTWNASVPRNLGALISDQDSGAFLFVDSDVVLPRHALQCYVEDLEKNPDRVVIGSYDFYRDGNEQVAVEDVRHVKFETVTVDETFTTVHDGLACFGGNLLIPKDIFWSVKGFSVDTHIGLEDGDMGLKLWKAGTKFSYDNRTKGKHLFHPTPPDRFPPDMKNHIDKLNLKHFHDVNPDYGIVEASRETYASWGITGWNPPVEWTRGRMEFDLKVRKVK